MKQQIQELLQEVQLLQVEKGSLEKEMTVILLRSGSALRQPTQVNGTLLSSVNRLCDVHMTIRQRIEELKSGRGVLPAANKMELQQSEQLFISQVELVRRELESLLAGLTTAVAVLLKKH